MLLVPQWCWFYLRHALHCRCNQLIRWFHASIYLYGALQNYVAGGQIHLLSVLFHWDSLDARRWHLFFFLWLRVICAVRLAEGEVRLVSSVDNVNSVISKLLWSLKIFRGRDIDFVWLYSNVANLKLAIWSKWTITFLRCVGHVTRMFSLTRKSNWDVNFEAVQDAWERTLIRNQTNYEESNGVLPLTSI